MKKYRWLIILLIVALAATGAWLLFFKKSEVAAVVITEMPHHGDISNSITSTGTIQPVDTVVVGSQISGPIQFIYVDFNSKVKKGQLIAQIDPIVLQAQLQQIQANLASANSQVAYEKSTYDRQSQLFNVGAISKADYETALNNYNTAKAQVESLQSQITAAQKNLSYTAIYSPIDGTVLSRNVSVGQTVAASFNTPTLFIIAKDLTKMQVQAAVDEADIGNVDTTEDATFTVDAFPNDIFKGRVRQIRLEPAVSANVVTYSTIIDAANEDLKLKPGMTASVTVITKESKNALLIPAKALTFKPDSTQLKNYAIIGRGMRNTGGGGQKKANVFNDSSGKKINANHLKITDSLAQVAYVWLKTGDTLKIRRVRVGLNDDTNVEVIAGLTENDEVVTGVGQPSAPKTNTSAEARSPFMPARQGARSSTGSGSGAAAKKP